MLHSAKRRPYEGCVPGGSPPPESSTHCETDLGCVPLHTPPDCSDPNQVYFWVDGYCRPDPGECEPKTTYWNFNVYECDQQECVVCEACAWDEESQQMIDAEGFECAWDLVRTQVIGVPDCIGNVCPGH